MGTEKRIDITQPLWDQSTFVGRWRHFAFISNPLLSMAGQEPSGTKLEQVVRAKQLYESAFHPDSGELQNVFGRMSFQMPGGCIITGAMLQFYRTATAVVFWQWVNQSFNALVNYTNRNANSPLTTNQMAVAYVSATSAAMGAALLFKYRRIECKPFMQRIRWAHAGIQTAVVGMFKLSIDTIKRFEKENYDEIVKNTNGKPPQY
ncbi:Sideroflexin-2-like protein, partial [Operophtera brumata]